MANVEHVEWVDSHGSGGWDSSRAYNEWIHESLPTMHTIGVVTFEDDYSVVLSQSFGADEVMNSIKIPKACISSRNIISQIDQEIVDTVFEKQSNIKHLYGVMKNIEKFLDNSEIKGK